MACASDRKSRNLRWNNSSVEPIKFCLRLDFWGSVDTDQNMTPKMKLNKQDDDDDWNGNGALFLVLVAISYDIELEYG